MAKRRRKPPCGQPMPNAHGEPSGHIVCTRPAGHPLPHEHATDYVRHTWEPPVCALPAAPAPARKPVKAPKPPRPPARPRPRSRSSRRRRSYPRRGGWPRPVRAVLEPLIGLGLAGAAVHILYLVLPSLA